MQGTFSGWVGKGQTFGFITPDDGSEKVLLHRNDAKAMAGLTKGAKLSFDPVPGMAGKGPKATNVSILVPGVETSVGGESIQGRGKVTRWNAEKGYGFVAPEGGGSDVFVHATIMPPAMAAAFDSDLFVEFVATIVPGEHKPRATAVTVIGRTSTPDDPFRADIETPESEWAELAELAEKETWDYTRTPQHETVPILRSYIRYTYRRLKEMDNAIRVSTSGRRAAFNTGLVTPNQEEIFGVLATHPTGYRQPWLLAGFKKASDRDVVEHFGGALPPLADYFDDPSVLLYDRRCPLIINIDHVLENIGRFPPAFQQNEHLLRQAMAGARADVEKRVYRNYKAAIPQYYRDKGRGGTVQLLLPMCLTNPSQADVALTVAKNREGTAYLGSTVLSLDMAYNNARLLSRPDTEWLQP